MGLFLQLLDSLTAASTTRLETIAFFLSSLAVLAGFSATGRAWWRATW